MCSANLECGYATKVKAKTFAWAYHEDEQAWLDEHPEQHEDGLVSVKDWNIGGNYFRKINETDEEYFARKRASGWLPLKEAMVLAIEYGKKLKSKAPDRKVWIRENYYCSGSEIRVFGEIDDTGTYVPLPEEKWRGYL